MKTTEEIEKEIEKLQKLRGEIPEVNAFGDNNIAAIDAQIETLSERMDEYTVEKKSWDSNKMDAAYHAAYWMQGEDEMSPSESWEPCARH